MASPVDTSVKFFHSGMANAPALNGVAGSLLSVLDACLVDGFDLKTATSLVVSGGVATLTFAGTHAAEKDAVILVSGSSIAALNGEQKVVSKSGTTITFATAAADGAASGTITFKMAPAGWLKAFGGTNLAAYKSADPTSTRCLLRVDDTGTTIARVIGYETMTDVSTGTGPFPTQATVAGGGYWGKSGTANSTANRWFIAADSKFFILHVAPMIGNSPVIAQGWTRCFGDMIAYRPSGDAFACVIGYSDSSNVSSHFSGGLDSANSGTANFSSPRAHTGLGSTLGLYSLPFVGNQSAISGLDNMFGSFPSVVDGSLRLSKRFFSWAVSSAPPRGEVPGIHHVSQSETFTTFPFATRTVGSGALAGRSLFALNPGSTLGSGVSNSNTGVSFVDITGPWR